ncbi:hypothetical protein ACWERY_11145 [Streptomyces sp. NPDC004082]|uniref:hypothetical protein n=1 Tax=unclassified Streptomyces TaxID=2593676 RepID=UPI00339F96B2
MDVLWQFQGEPAHAMRERCRADRERLVRQPMITLLNEAADADPRCEDFSVWHYRTDSWWWQHQGAVIRLGRKIEIGLHVCATTGWLRPSMVNDIPATSQMQDGWPRVAMRDGLDQASRARRNEGVRSVSRPGARSWTRWSRLSTPGSAQVPLMTA